ncbi:MAG TPA: hypothetical protein VFI53_04360, partial [Myxococcaceae bacterium]|nr:hypothetical protein [Myxococcaceae bacterium]
MGCGTTSGAALPSLAAGVLLLLGWRSAAGCCSRLKASIGRALPLIRPYYRVVVSPPADPCSGSSEPVS